MASAGVPVSETGWRAFAALQRAGGLAHPVARLSESIYLRAAGEIVWLGRIGAPLHARAMLTTAPLSDSGPLRLDPGRAHVWRPRALVGHGWEATIAAGCRALREAAPTLGEARGFGPLLTGSALAFPLDRARNAAVDLARACVADDARAAAAAAGPLIGLGPGLTPAGDDYVGAAFFARALLDRGGAGGDEWPRARAWVRALARARTHPISAALLGDLLAGRGHAPLHELAAALCAAAPPAVVVAAARRLISIGHSSGWDMLAGFVGGILGVPALTTAVE